MGISIGRPGGRVVASSGMISFAARISGMEVLNLNARFGSVSPLWTV
jgi:hypothetical protein